MVTEGCSLKKSDWITKAGRGLPYAPGRMTVTRSPRDTPLSPAFTIPSRFQPREHFCFLRIVSQHQRLTPASRTKAALPGIGQPKLDRPQSGRPQFCSMLVHAVYCTLHASVLHVTLVRNSSDGLLAYGAASLIRNPVVFPRGRSSNRIPPVSAVASNISSSSTST